MIRQRTAPILGRRDLLRGLGAGAVFFVPFLRSLEAAAQGSAPRRVILMCIPNGRDKETWYGARRSATDFDLSASLKPLEPYKKDMVLIRGNYMDIGDHRGDGHFHGNVFAYSGWRTGGGTKYDQLSGGPSLEFALQAQLFPTKPVLPIGIGNPGHWRIAWSGKETPASVYNSALETFNTVFKNDMPSTGSQAALQKAMLERVHKDVGTLKARLGAPERELLDVHMDGLQTIINGFSDPSGGSVQCTVPAKPLDERAYRTQWREQIRVLADAFACDRSRAASIQFGWFTHNHSGNIGGFSQDSHSYSHWYEKSGSESDDYHQKRRLMDQQFAAYIAELVEELKRRKEGNGSVFDNTAIVWYSEISDGHDFRDMPCVVLGSLGGRLATGQFLELSGKTGSQNNLLIALAQGMGWNTNTFGDPGYCSGPTPGLLKT